MMSEGEVMSISQGRPVSGRMLASIAGIAPNHLSLNTGDGLFVLLSTVPVLRPLSSSVCTLPISNTARYLPELG
jgi:hypothetical protein